MKLYKLFYVLVLFHYEPNKLFLEILNIHSIPKLVVLSYIQYIIQYIITYTYFYAFQILYFEYYENSKLLNLSKNLSVFIFNN